MDFQEQTLNADDQRLLRYRDPDVLEGSRATAHALYAEHEALVDIRELSILRGSLPRRAMALVLEWAAERRNELAEDWTLCSQLQPPKPIEPLK